MEAMPRRDAPEREMTCSPEKSGLEAEADVERVFRFMRDEGSRSGALEP